MGRCSRCLPCNRPALLLQLQQLVSVKQLLGQLLVLIKLGIECADLFLHVRFLITKALVNVCQLLHDEPTAAENMQVMSDS
jgi:hypothetical protein